MKPYSAFQATADGRVFSVRYLLDAEELQALQAAGLVPMDAAEIMGLQEVTDTSLLKLKRYCMPTADEITQ